MSDQGPIQVPSPRETVLVPGGFFGRVWYRYLANAQNANTQTAAAVATVETAANNAVTLVENVTNQTIVGAPGIVPQADVEDRLRAVELKMVALETHVPRAVEDAMKMIPAQRPNLMDGVAVVDLITDAGAHTGTLTNSPTAGDPAFWLRLRINGVNYAVPLWTAA